MRHLDTHTLWIQQAVRTGRVDLSIHNVLGKRYQTLSYLDKANATTTDDDGNIVAKYPSDIAGEGRAFNLGVEVSF